MSRRAGVSILLLAVLLGWAGGRFSRPLGPAPLAETQVASSPPPKPCFGTPEEAKRYALARILASDQLDSAGDSYSSTFTRSYTTLDGRTTHYFLVSPPARELELAEGFAAHGFYREALCHYENLVAYYPKTSQGDRARGRLEECRRHTVFGLVPPMTVLFKDSQGHLFVPAQAMGSPAPSLDRNQDVFLEPAEPAPGPLEAVGFVDDAGAIVRWTGAFQVVFPAGQGHEGALRGGRGFYEIAPARSLFEAEALAKSSPFKNLADRLGPPGPNSGAQYRLAAEALIYLGRRDEAQKILNDLGDPIPSNPLPAQAEAILANPLSPLYLDALWLTKAKKNPGFKLTTASSVTSGSDLPVEIDARSLESMKFTFASLLGPMPPTEKELREWLPKAPTRESHSETLALVPGKSTIRLPIRAPGAYRVTAEAAGLTGSFIAIRTDLLLEAFALPGETFVAASRGGITLASREGTLGTTGADGYLEPSGAMLPRICPAHKDCCATCESCAHHHSDAQTPGPDAQVLVTGAGQFFRATAKIETGSLAKVTVPPPAPFLFVHTDRPVYKAGDTLKFRGILRFPKSPLGRRDPCRLLPGAERQATVAIRCGDADLFTRTYVTGEHGTFSGEYTLPLTAYRARYSLVVTCEGTEATQPFEVLDYRKSDYSIVLTPEALGVRVQAGYVWGAPVAGARLRCMVAGRATEFQDSLIPAKDGEPVRVTLLRGEEELAEKSLVFRAPVRGPSASEKSPDPRPAEGPPLTPKPEVPDPTPDEASPQKPRSPSFAVKASKSLYGRGEVIELEIEGPWAEAEATVLLGDLRVYDVARVPLRGGRGVARFPARAIHDPGVTAFALCRGEQARTEILVRADLMPVALAAPAQGRPGQEVEVTLRGDPAAAFALSAVDEAIYMLREDDTPEIYDFFHPARPAALAYGRFEKFEFDGDTCLIESAPSDPCFRIGSPAGDRLFRESGLYETIGVGAGGGGGGRFGGKVNLVARGAGSRATESPVLAALKGPATLQKPDGSWACVYATEGGTISDVGGTSLVVLSYLGAGYSHLSKDQYPDPTNLNRALDMGVIIRRSIQWLITQQAPDGRIGPISGDSLLNHALGALALSEAYGMTASEPLKGPAERALRYLFSQQCLNGGWHRNDSSRSGEPIPSVLAVMALKSAQLSDFPIPSEIATAAFRYFDQTIREDGLLDDSPTRAKVGGGALAFLFLRSKNSDPRLSAAARWLVQNPPDWSQPDFLGWYLASLALFQYDGPEGPCWKPVHEALKNTLVPHQLKNGFWPQGGDLIVPTALANLCLEVYYRYSNVFGGGKGGSPGSPQDKGPLAPAARVRIYFPDTAFWAPELITGPTGEARVSFKLPDQITSTRLTARGIGKEGAAGQAVARIRTEQPFFTRIQAPEFAVLGDEIEVRIDLYNYTRTEQDAKVELEGYPPEVKVHLPTDRPASATWRVRADDPAGLRLVARAQAGGHSDAMERLVPVRQVGRETLATMRGRSETGLAYKIEAPPGTRELTVKLHPQKGSLTQVLDALAYLNTYPHG